eukprot:13346677-Ditylum_brightwellii.AAC.1
METFLKGSSIQNAIFMISGKHHFQMDFGSNVTEAVTDIELDIIFFKKFFKHSNGLLKAAAMARDTGVPFRLLLPKLELEAKFTLKAKAAVSVEAQMSCYVHHTNNITYSAANVWDTTPNFHPEVFTSKDPQTNIKGEVFSSLKLIP